MVFAIRAWASSVTTTDGINFNVTNDAGFTSAMTAGQIIRKVSQFNSQLSQDSQQYLSDQESLVIWNGVEQ